MHVKQSGWHQFHQLLHSHYERVKLRSSLVFSAADAIKKTDCNLLLFEQEHRQHEDSHPFSVPKLVNEGLLYLVSCMWLILRRW